MPPASVSSRSTAIPRINGVTASAGTAASMVVIVFAGIRSPVRQSQKPYGKPAPPSGPYR